MASIAFRVRVHCAFIVVCLAMSAFNICADIAIKVIYVVWKEEWCKEVGDLPRSVVLYVALPLPNSRSIRLEGSML